MYVETRHENLGVVYLADLTTSHKSEYWHFMGLLPPYSANANLPDYKTHSARVRSTRVHSAQVRSSLFSHHARFFFLLHPSMTSSLFKNACHACWHGGEVRLWLLLKVDVQGGWPLHSQRLGSDLK